MLTRELGVFTAYFATRPTTEPTKLLTTLEGPAIVLTEAERRKSVISRIYISRHTDPEVIRQLETARTKGIPVIETSAAELTLMANCRPHGGVVAMLGGRPKERSLIERALWFLTRLAIHESARSPARP